VTARLYDVDAPVTAADLAPGRSVYRLARPGVDDRWVRVWLPCHPRKSTVIDREQPSADRLVMCTCQRQYRLEIMFSGEWLAQWTVTEPVQIIIPAYGERQPHGDTP
jgi:hypothetical protein